MGIQSFTGSASQAAAARNGEGLDAQLASHLGRLYECETRLRNIGDAIHGSQVPAEIGTGTSSTGTVMPLPPTSIASRVNDLGNLVGAVENAVNRIQGAL